MPAGNYISYLKGANTNIKRGLLALFLHSLGMGIFTVLFNLYLQQLGYTESLVGQMISLQSLAAVLTLIPAGIISDRWGRRVIMLFSCTLKSICLLFIALTGIKYLLMVFVFGLGMAHAFFGVVTAPFLAENTQPGERIHIFSISFALGMASSMLGHMFGGWIPEALQRFAWATLPSFQATLIFAALLAFAAILPVLAIKETPRDKKQTWQNLLLVITKAKELKTIGKFIFANLLLGLGAGLFVPYYNLFFANVFNLSLGKIGTIMAFRRASTASLSLIGPYLATKIGKVRAICFFQLASIIFLLIMGRANLLYPVIFSFLVRGGLMNAANPITNNLMMDNVPDRIKGAASSLQQLVFQLGWVVCAPLSGYLIATHGYTLVFDLAAGLYLFSSIYFFLAFKNLELPEKTAPTHS